MDELKKEAVKKVAGGKFDMAKERDLKKTEIINETRAGKGFENVMAAKKIELK